jgi:hypothetical protein
MKTLFKKAVAALVVIFVGVSVFAISDDATYAGYSVNSIIFKTIELFLYKDLLKEDSKTFDAWAKYQNEANRQEGDNMLPVFPFFDFENSFINYCLDKNLITLAQANIAIDRSKHSGGLELNGYNLVFLHAGILWSLIENKKITLKEAQNLLDSCLVKK